MITKGLKPEKVLYYFEELTKIPRCSRDEKRVSDYLKGVAEKLGLEVHQDNELNIIIKKPGSKGYENKQTVIIQGHMDMVCEKADDFEIDFSKEPIPIEVRDDLIIAPKTTLGADNGIAVAMALAILDSDDIQHPPLEVIVTTNEESGMTGAANIDKELINGKILINIDSEEEGVALVSCAGGKRFIVKAPIKLKKSDKVGYTLKVSGLMGGHSGMEINKERGNSNRILGRALKEIKDLDFDLYHLDGGSKSNAIPRLAVAKIGLDADKVEAAKKIIESFGKMVQTELQTSDPDVVITLEKGEDIKDAFVDELRDNLIAALILIPSGVQRMSMDIEGLVESSNNLGVVKTTDEYVTLESAIRSSVQSLKEFTAIQISEIAELLKFEYEAYGEYPAWIYKKDSYIREVFKDAYKSITGKDLKIEAIHAGLETGLFNAVLGDIDMISFGPDMWGVHAPGEKVSISSVERCYNLLLEVLKKID